MEKRCIELAVVKVEDNKVIFKITKQTHKDNEFCQQINSNEFFASNGYKLVSYAMPAFNLYSHELFCQGEFTEHNNNEIDCNLEDFAKICEATTEYNITDGKGYEKHWPKLNDKYYIVSNCGEVLQYNFDGCNIDLELKNIGNFYRTFEKASKVAEKVKLLFKNSQ